MTLSSLHGDAADQSQREDFELPLFEFARIAKATNNFSNNNKLGEGGFGPVYMVLNFILIGADLYEYEIFYIPIMTLFEFRRHR